MKFVLSRPGIFVIPGVEQSELFDKNWEIFQSSYDLEDGEKNEMVEIRRPWIMGVVGGVTILPAPCAGYPHFRYPKSLAQVLSKRLLRRLSSALNAEIV